MNGYTRGPAIADSVLTIPTMPTSVTSRYPTHVVRKALDMPRDQNTTVSVSIPICPYAPKRHSVAGSLFILAFSVAGM